MSFSLEDYIGLLSERKLDEALNYRKRHMPKILYKYASLYDVYICGEDKQQCSVYQKKNASKFDALSKNLIWLSRYWNLNDPYEYKAMYLLRKELEDKGWPIDMLEDYINRMENIFLIGCFSSNLVDNMPMWAHYANNHKGFCIEYHVLNPKVVYPISYEKTRFGVASILTSIFNLGNKIANGEIDEHDKEFQFYMTLISHLGLIKHNTWSYENEYRILHADSGRSEPGALVPLINVGLDIAGIYIGSDCSAENKDKLLNIANSININAYEMYLVDDEPDFKLNYRKL